MVRDWHAKKPGSTAPLDASGRPRLVLESINTKERVELGAESDQGGFSEADHQRAAHLLRDTVTGDEHPIDPALLSLLYRLQRKFDAPAVRVISGYRTPRGKSHGRHSEGAAVDLVLPGVKDSAVAAYARTLGSTGVGIYPRAGYVHVDVREKSYFWRDMSGPGQRGTRHR